MQQFIDTLTDVAGNSLLGATLTVTNYPSGTLATIYSANGTAAPIANSVVAADITGQVSFYVPDGAYILTYAYKSTVYKVRSPVEMFDAMALVTVVDTGAANAYVVTDQRLPAQLYAGLKVKVQITHANTAASTLNVNSTGAQPIQFAGGAAIGTGTLALNGLYLFEWTGTAWQILAGVPLSGSIIGGILWPQTAAEASASITPTTISRMPEPVYDLLRLGLVPNSTGARAANSAKLKALLDPTLTGPVGWFLFTNTTGADTYYFDSVAIQIRDGCRLDLCKTTVDFAGSFTSANDTLGFFTAIRDVEICNGTINVNYDGSAGSNNGMAIRLGARVGYVFAGNSNFQEEFLTTPIGHCWLHDLRVSSNNGSAGTQIVIAAFGGLVNTRLERITVDGQNVCYYAFYYEFGDWHYEATVANRKTSHAINMVLDQISSKNLKTSSGATVGLVGCNPATVSNINCNVGYSPIEMRCGEALYYNVGPPYAVGGQTRWHTLSNISGQGCLGAITLTGSESAAGGYLHNNGSGHFSDGSGTALTDAQQCDLLGFTVNNIDVDCSVSATGPFILNGGTIRGGNASGALIIGQDVLFFDVNGTNILDANNEGVRADTANGFRLVPRNKRGVFRNAKVCGSHFGGAGQAGIGLGLCDDVRVMDCQLGYSTLYDNINEALQTFGVSGDNTSSGIVLDNNYVKPSAGNAYNKTAGPAGCIFMSGRGTLTFSGDMHYGGPRKQSVVTYSASMTPDCMQGTDFVIAATNNTAFTINAPLNPFHGMTITISIQNISGGALGAATFNGVFKQTAGWIQPGNGFNRGISYRYNGASWYELPPRSSADVPN